MDEVAPLPLKKITSPELSVAGVVLDFDDAIIVSPKRGGQVQANLRVPLAQVGCDNTLEFLATEI